MGRYWLILCAITFWFVTPAHATDPIVKDGKSDWVIYSPSTATPTESLAARELARYLKQMSGVDLPIQNALPDSRNYLLVCNYDKTKTLITPDNFAKAKTADGFTTVAAANCVWISGQSDGATLRAVYAFLDSIGCRFLAPHLDHYKGSAELVPKVKDLSISESHIGTFEPALSFRKLYVEEGHSHTPPNLVQMVEWMPKVGYNTLVVPTDYQGSGRVKWDNFREKVAPECQKRGILIEVGGHGYQNFLNAEMEDGKLFTQHPDWFGKNAQGQPQKAKGWVFCTSNLDATQYLIKNFLAYIKERPEIQIYDFWPPDGAKWCECDKCKELGTPSDRQAILVAQVKEAVAPIAPDLRLEVLAYHTSVTPPEKVKLDKSILLDFCPINQQFDHQINDPAADKNAEYVTGLTAWRKAFDGDISIYSYYRKYAWDSLPVIIPHYMQKDLQWYATLPVQGVSTYAEPGDWFTYELNHYVLAHLAWDPNTDVDALVKKFCDARYGDHAAVAQEALLTLEEITRNTSSIPNTALKSSEQIEADLARAAKIEKSAKDESQRAADASIKRNLERLALICGYAHRDLEVQKLRAAKAPDDQIRKQAEEVHRFVTSHADEGVFLVHNQRLSLSRKLRRYGIQAKE